MKIDLRKDKGVLGSVSFLISRSKNVEPSEDERIAETMRRRRTAHQSDSEDKKVEPESTDPSTIDPNKAKSSNKVKQNTGRQLLLFVLMLASFAYYLYDKGDLFSSIDTAKQYLYELVGMQVAVMDTSGVDEDTLVEEGLLPEAVFNVLMPVTPHIAALADSIAMLPAESLYVDPTSSDDSSEYDYVYIPVVEKQIELSDDDLTIINNRSMLLLATEILDNYPSEYGNGHLFLKRDALTVSAPRGGEWVGQIKSTLDKFVSGSFNEDYSTGNAKLTSKFDLIMYAEPGFQPQILSAIQLLDVLANPFNDYLRQIVIDLPRGVEDNPAKFAFAGTIQEMQYVLSSWAESRNNIRLTSIDVEFQGDELTLTIGAVFFTYQR